MPLAQIFLMNHYDTLILLETSHFRVMYPIFENRFGACIRTYFIDIYMTVVWFHRDVQNYIDK